MKIGLIKCTEENLVALVPKVVSRLVSDGYDVYFETGASDESNYSDEEYVSAGAKSADREDIIVSSDILITVAGLSDADISKIKPETFVVGKFGFTQGLIQTLEDHKIKAFSLERLPRSSIAQSMDVLSSLASLSGYKAVLLSADNFGGYFPMMTTSAGTIPPAKILIIGAGVAGLQAIATARRLGAVVEAFDVRSSVKEQVESLGAKFIEVAGSTEDAGAGGYAVEQTEDYIAKQKELIHQSCIKADAVITTAAIPGKKAPVLVEKRTVQAMNAGSVIVDLAAATGGNCELTENDEMINVEGVKIIGDSRLYNSMSKQASLVFSNNVYSFLKFVFKDGLEAIPYDNEIVSKTLISERKERTVSA
ncbi:MAG: NAD(P) transhydrogenase subunit alpha [Cyclobacteriaceae bacterium]